MSDHALIVVGMIFPKEMPMPERYVCLECDGTRLWRIDWPELFAALDTLFGGDNTPAHFNLPNSRTRIGIAGEWRPYSEPMWKIVARIEPEPVAA